MITRSHTMVQQALENDYLIKRKDLECRVEKLPKKLLDENVNMACQEIPHHLCMDTIDPNERKITKAGLGL